MRRVDCFSPLHLAMKEERPTSITNDTLVTLPRTGLCSGNLLKCTLRGVAGVRHNHQMFGLMEDIVYILFMLFYLHHPVSSEKEEKESGSSSNHEQQKDFLLLLLPFLYPACFALLV